MYQAIVFLPLLGALIAGLFGMNVGGIPFANDRQGFLLIVFGLALLSGAAAYLALGRRRD